MTIFERLEEPIGLEYYNLVTNLKVYIIQATADGAIKSEVGRKLYSAVCEEKLALNSEQKELLKKVTKFEEPNEQTRQKVLEELASLE